MRIYITTEAPKMVSNPDGSYGGLRLSFGFVVRTHGPINKSRVLSEGNGYATKELAIAAGRESVAALRAEDDAARKAFFKLAHPTKKKNP